jgi:hypothetical protein
MPSTAEISALGVGVLGCLLVLGCSVPSFREIVRRFRLFNGYGAIRLHNSDSESYSDPHSPFETGYVDEDGDANEQSIADFERATKWQRWVISALSVVGFGVSLAQAVVGTCSKGGWVALPSWGYMASWVSG